MKTCTKCGETEFYSNGACKSCQKQKVYQRQQEILNWLREQKNVPCADCGQSYPYYVMDFDHLEDKLFNLSAHCVKTKGFKQIKSEVAKCDVVCSNCHRIRTYNRLKE